MKTYAWIVALMGAAALAACGGTTTEPTGTGGKGGAGGDTGGGGSGGGAFDWDGYCQKSVEREMMCDPNNPPSPTLAECQGAESCLDAVIRPDAKADFLDCLANRPCNKS